MKELNPDTLRRVLLIEQGIEQQLDPIVQQANQTAALLEKLPTKQGKYSDMEESQLRNLLNAALESRSIEAVINFIRYQISRPGSAWGIAPDSFGHTVIKNINEQLPRWATDVITFVCSQPSPPVLAIDEERNIRVRLMQIYLGYLNRAFYYGSKTGRFAHLKQINAATVLPASNSEGKAV